MAKKTTKKAKKQVTNPTIEQQIQERMKKHVLKETMIEFSRKVEALVQESITQGTNYTYTEAIVDLNDQKEHQYEPEKLAKLLTAEIKAKMQKEAEDLHLIKREHYRLDD